MLRPIAAALLLGLPLTVAEPAPPGATATASDCHPWVTVGTEFTAGWFCVHVAIAGIDHGCTKVAGGSRCTFEFGYNASAGAAPSFVNLTWHESLVGKNGGCDRPLFCVANTTGTGNLSVFVPRGRTATVTDRIAAGGRWLFGAGAAEAEASLTFHG